MDVFLAQVGLCALLNCLVANSILRVACETGHHLHVSGISCMVNVGPYA